MLIFYNIHSLIFTFETLQIYLHFPLHAQQTAIYLQSYC